MGDKDPVQPIEITGDGNVVGDGNTSTVIKAEQVTINQYAGRRADYHAPFQAPAVPRYYVPRPEVSDDLKRLLLDDEPTAPGALVVSAIHGLGGIGKTTLVAALAHDSDLRARFPDGILWATLGQESDVLSLLAGWIQAMGDYDFHPTLIESASAHLRTLLHDKTCLLVVDDAWQADAARAFLVGGERCRVLVTTRDATLARKVGATLYDLDVMTEAQALALFEARLGPLDGYRGQTAMLAHELGYLPLALELAAAQVEGGLAWDELLGIFRQGLADLAALDLDDATYRNESLRLTFRLSLERLSLEDMGAFVWLGVLPEDARLNPTMAATLWDQSEAEARKRLRRLRDKALFKMVGDERYTLHDLLHDEARLRLAEMMPLAQGHAALLNRYRACCTNDWPSLPDDGYIHQHLTWHMEQAGQVEVIHAMLRQETVEGHNAWYETREALNQTIGYLADVRRAWRLAEEEFTNRQSLVSIGFQCRYALITTSLNTIAKNIPPTLLAALVEKGVWTATQALSYARQVPTSRRVPVLVKLIPLLPEHHTQEVLQEALAAARATPHEDVRATALGLLVPFLSEPLKGEVLQETAQAAKFGKELAAAMLGGAITGQNAQTADTKPSPDQPAQTLVQLAPSMSEVQVRDALKTIGTLPYDDYDTVLVTLLLRLVELGYFEEALAEARATKDTTRRVRVLVELAARSSETLKAELLREAIAGVLSELSIYKELTFFGRQPLSALATLAPHATEPLLQELWEAAKALPTYPFMWGFIPRAGTLDINPKLDALAALAPYLPVRLLLEALTATRTLEDADQREFALLRFGYWQLVAVAISGHPQMALAVATEIKNEESRAEALVRLAPYVSEPLLQEALRAAKAIELPLHRDQALIGLAPYLPKALLLEALAVTREVTRRDAGQCEAMLGLVPYLPGPQKEETLSEVLSIANTIEGEVAKIKVFAGLIPHLQEPRKREILTDILMMARRIESSSSRVQALAELILHLPEPQKEEVLQEALQLVEAEWQKNPKDHMEALAALAPHLPKPYRREILRKALKDVYKREHIVLRYDALANLAPRLAEVGCLHEAWEAAQMLEIPLQREPIIVEIMRCAAQLPRYNQYDFWREVLHTTATYARKDLLTDLRAMEPVIFALGGSEAIAETFRAIQDVGRWWP